MPTVSAASLFGIQIPGNAGAHVKQIGQATGAKLTVVLTSSPPNQNSCVFCILAPSNADVPAKVEMEGQPTELVTG